MSIKLLRQVHPPLYYLSSTNNRLVIHLSRETTYHHLIIITFPDDKSLHFPNFQNIGKPHKKVALMMGYFCERVENIEGKRTRCWLPAFSPFPMMFSKAFFLKGGYLDFSYFTELKNAHITEI